MQECDEMAMMTISPWLLCGRGDYRLLSGSIARHIPSSGGRYAPAAGPDPTAGGGRG
jgi:hypothetical protein